jgi:Ni/Co efflux regulator RcnB
MKKFLIPAIALAAASVAVPAMAQNYGPQQRYEQNRGDRYDRDDDRDRGDRYERDNRGGWQSISQRKYQLDRRIDNGLRNGSLSRREATRLKTELNQLVRLEYSYQRGGLSARERMELDRRYDMLARQVREERRDRDNRRY